GRPQARQEVGHARPNSRVPTVAGRSEPMTRSDVDPSAGKPTRRPLSRVLFPLLLALLGLVSPRAEAKPVDACRSVHLHYPAPEAVAFCNEVTVDRSAPGTYFCACGFHMGYFGIQELGNGKKVVIFSVWEPGRQDDPKAVAEERRVRLVAKGE